MIAKGYPSRGRFTGAALYELVESFFQGQKTFHFCIDPPGPLFEIGAGAPAELSPQGRVFSANGEVRWELVDGGYDVLVLSETDTVSSGLTPLDGDWTVEDDSCILTKPEASHIAPPFTAYPVKDASRMRVGVFKRNDMPVFTRLKEWLP